VTGVTVRPARDGDGPAITALGVAAADTGAVRVAPNYLVDPLLTSRALRPEAQWVLAETADGNVVGAGFIDFDDVEIEGDVYPCAHLSGLMVHPDHRRRGIAGALTEWRLERAGADSVVVAAIQSGNEGSFANARKWATQIFGTMVVPAVKVAPGKTSGDFEIREPQDDSEWEQVVAGLAEFERGWNLRIPQTAAAVRERLARSPLDERVQWQVVAVEDGRLVGGYELHDNSRLSTLVVERVPAFLRALNVVARIIPKDGVIRNVSVARLWHAPGRADAGRALWSHACATPGSARANAVGTQFDPRGPLAKLVSIKPWTVKGKLSVAIRSPVRLDEERLLAPP
jgi:predicted N-acetyltransferase YhbS